MRLYLLQLCISRPFPQISAKINAWTTSVTCTWLMGSMEVNDIDLDDGEVQRSINRARREETFRFIRWDIDKAFLWKDVVSLKKVDVLRSVTTAVNCQPSSEILNLSPLRSSLGRTGFFQKRNGNRRHPRTKL